MVLNRTPSIFYHVFWYETIHSLSVLVFPLSNHWFVQFSCAVFYMKPSIFSVVFMFLKWNRSFFLAILRMVFTKMKLSIFQLFVFAIWNYFPHVFLFVHMKRPIFSICFYVFRIKELMFIYICFGYETHGSLISLCLCICNHRFVFSIWKQSMFAFVLCVVHVKLLILFFFQICCICLFEKSFFRCVCYFPIWTIGFSVCRMLFLRDIIVFLFVVRFFLWDQRFFVASCIFMFF